MVPYFNNLAWRSFNAVEGYGSWIDRTYTNFYALNYAHRGEVYFQGPGDEQPVLVQAPVAWTTWPGVRFRYGSFKGNTWEHRWVTFRGPRADAMDAGGLIRVDGARLVARVAKPEPFRVQFDELLSRLRAPKVDLARSIHVLEGLLLDVLEARQSRNTDDSALGSIRTLGSEMVEDPKREWDLPRWASDRGMSYSHFRHLFRQVHQEAPRQFQIKARMQWAGKLMRDDRRTLREIAREVGIDDEKYFSRLFRKSFGVSPGAYQRGIGLELKKRDEQVDGKIRERGFPSEE